MTQQDRALIGGKKAGGDLFSRGKPLFSISSQHVAAAAATAFQLESDQVPPSASRLTPQQSLWEYNTRTLISLLPSFHPLSVFFFSSFFMHPLHLIALLSSITLFSFPFLVSGGLTFFGSVPR